MKTSLLVLFAGTALTLSAQQGTAWVAAYAGQTLFDSDAKVSGYRLKDQFHWGFGLGHWYTDRWGLDLRAITDDLESKAPSPPKGAEGHLLASGLYNLRPGARTWYPYLAAGLGGTVVSSGYSPSAQMTTRLNYHAGLGLMGKPTEAFLLDLSAKAVRVELPKSRTEYLLTLGLGYAWGGGPKPAPAAAPAPAPAPVPAPAPAPPAPEPKDAPAPPPPPPPPAPAPEAAKPVPPPPARIVLDEAVLHFANGKADLGPDAKAAIQKVADGLKDYPGDYTLVVSGHTSSVGGRALNKTLSKLRADAVAGVLVDSGIPASRITTQGVGPDKPIADNATKNGQAKNRRVEIDVKAKEGQAQVRKTETGLVEAPAPSRKAGRKPPK